MEILVAAALAALLSASSILWIIKKIASLEEKLSSRISRIEERNPYVVVRESGGMPAGIVDSSGVPWTEDIVDSWRMQMEAIGVPPTNHEVNDQKQMWEEFGT